MSLADADSSSAQHPQQADMRLVPGGTFRMGSDGGGERAVRIDDCKYRFIDQPGGWLGKNQA